MISGAGKSMVKVLKKQKKSAEMASKSGIFPENLLKFQAFHGGISVVLGAKFSIFSLFLCMENPCFYFYSGV